MPARKPAEIPLPESWTGHVRSAMLHVIALAQYAAVYTRSWAASSTNARVRLKADNDRLRQEVGLLTEELRIKDARMQCIPPHRRPAFPADRADGDSRTGGRPQLVQPAGGQGLPAHRRHHRLLEEAAHGAGEEALVRMPEPVNKFPDFVRYVVQRLKVLCPSSAR